MTDDLRNVLYLLTDNKPRSNNCQYEHGFRASFPNLTGQRHQQWPLKGTPALSQK